MLGKYITVTLLFGWTRGCISCDALGSTNAASQLSHKTWMLALLCHTNYQNEC